MTVPIRRLGIVSSVDVSCGNAAFTRILAESVERIAGVEVELLALDLELTQASSPLERRYADQHIDRLCRRMQGLDAVNVQFELGLYGSTPREAGDRLERLVDAHPRTFVTYHAMRTVDHDTVDPKTLVLGTLMNLQVRSAVRAALASRTAARTTMASRRYVDIACSRDRRSIVHTDRSARRIKRLWPGAPVAVHPLRLVDPAPRPEPTVVAGLRARFGLPEDAVVIGVFGYLGGYKGLDTALRAVALLPERHHLFVFGRQHPQTIRIGEPVHGTVSQPMALVEELELEERVHFVGELGDDEFVDAAAGVDAAWLPYLEVEQDGSGIAGIVFDVSRRVIASNSAAFDELFRLIPYEGVERFDIGNHLELAQKTLHPGPGVVRPDTPYTLESQALLYARGGAPG